MPAPTTLFLSPSGAEVHRALGFRNRGSFLAEMDRNLSGAPCGTAGGSGDRGYLVSVLTLAAVPIALFVWLKPGKSRRDGGR